MIKTLLSILAVLFLTALILSYYFFPLNENFLIKSPNSEFNISYNDSELQFYPNMRFAEKEVSYKILDCPLKKVNDMEDSFKTIETRFSRSFSNGSLRS